MTRPRDLPLACSTLGRRDAPLLLVLHGITASRRYWLPRIAALGQRYRLLIPDLPGFGESPKPHVDYTIDFFVEALLGLLARQEPRAPGLRVIGHSLGALIALEMAATRAVTVERMVLLSVPRFSDPETAHRLMLHGSASYRRLFALDSFGASWAQLRKCGWRRGARYLHRLPWRVLADTRKFTFRSLSSTLDHCLLHHNLDPVLRRYPTSAPPPLLIHGQRDPVAPLHALLEVSDQPPHPVLHVLPDAGHNPFHTHTAHCVGLFERYLEDPPALLARHALRP